MGLRKRSTAIIATIFALVLILAGCGSNSEEGSTDQKKNGSKDSNSYTVEHAMGKTTIKGTPEKVVILTNDETICWIHLAAGEGGFWIVKPKE